MSRPIRSPAVDTRARILGVALELVSERGFAGTSIRDLAERLDLTVAAIYYHFKSKDDLLDALVEPLIAGLTDLSAKAVSGELSQIDLLRELLTVMSGEGAKVMGVLHGDPSATLRLKARFEPDQIFAGLVRGIAGSDDRTALLRATCAVGAIQAAVIATSHTHPGPSGAWRGFDDADRAVVIQAAVATLRSGPPSREGNR